MIKSTRLRIIACTDQGIIIHFSNSDNEEEQRMCQPKCNDKTIKDENISLEQCIE